jgi:hypothetical protein
LLLAQVLRHAPGFLASLFPDDHLLAQRFLGLGWTGKLWAQARAVNFGLRLGLGLGQGSGLY